MTWPLRVQEIVNVLAAGVGHIAPDDLRRATTMRIAEQCRFELGSNWGTKRYTWTHPLSTDVICTQSPLVGWDWSVPAGIAQFPESIDLRGQIFVPVDPVDHLGAPPGPVPLPPAPSSDLTQVLNELSALKSLLIPRLDDLAIRVNSLVERPFPAYGGSASIRFLGDAPIALTPKE